MEKKEIKVINPVTVDGITIAPVVRIKISYGQSRRGVAFSGSAQPECILIMTPSGKRAFRMSGEEITCDQLSLENPGIAERIEEP